MSKSKTSKDERTWTECTAKCAHRGPFRIHYRSGNTSLINTKGCAPANFALLSDPTIVEKVTAPHDR